MPKARKKKRPPRRVLALPDLEQSKTAVLNSLTSKSGQRSYDHAITDFVEWYCSEPRLAYNRSVVLRYRIHLEQKQYAPTTINLRLAAVRRVAYEAADSGLLSPELAAGIRRVKGVRRIGVRIGNLAYRRPRQAATGGSGSRFASWQKKLCDPRHADRMRAPTRRVARPPRRGHSTPGRPLGHRRPGRQGGTHPDHSDSGLGEAGDRRMEGRQRDHPRRTLSLHQHDWPNLGEWDDPEGAVGGCPGSCLHGWYREACSS